MIGGILLQRVIRRVGRIWKHARIVAPSGRSREPVQPEGARAARRRIAAPGGHGIGPPVSEV